MRVPRIRRPLLGSTLKRSMPSKATVPPAKRQPGRTIPSAARPMVDLPAPDSPMMPRTSPRRSSRSMPRTIGNGATLIPPSIVRSRMASRWPATIVSAPCVPAAGAGHIPVHQEVDADGQKGNRSGGKQRRRIAIGDQRRVLSHHRSPVRRGRPDAHPKKGKGRNGEKNETEEQDELGNQ